MRVFNIFWQIWDRWLAALLLLLALGAFAWPAYRDYVSRKEVYAIAIPFDEVARRSMRAACSDGSFASKQTPDEFGIPDSSQIKGVPNVEIVRRSPGLVRLTVKIPDYGSLDFDYTCTVNKALSYSLALSSTVPAKYIPARLRP